MYTYAAAFDPFQASCSNADGAATPCFSIKIENSEFLDFGLMKREQDYLTWVDPQFKMRYQGTVIDLENFRGSI